MTVLDARIAELLKKHGGDVERIAEKILGNDSPSLDMAILLTTKYVEIDTEHGQRMAVRFLERVLKEKLSMEAAISTETVEKVAEQNYDSERVSSRNVPLLYLGAICAIRADEKSGVTKSTNPVISVEDYEAQLQTQYTGPQGNLRFQLTRPWFMTTKPDVYDFFDKRYGWSLQFFKPGLETGIYATFEPEPKRQLERLVSWRGSIPKPTNHRMHAVEAALEHFYGAHKALDLQAFAERLKTEGVNITKLVA